MPFTMFFTTNGLNLSEKLIGVNKVIVKSKIIFSLQFFVKLYWHRGHHILKEMKCIQWYRFWFKEYNLFDENLKFYHLFIICISIKKSYKSYNSYLLMTLLVKEGTTHVNLMKISIFCNKLRGILSNTDILWFLVSLTTA